MGQLLDNFLKVYQLANFIKHSRLQEERLRQQMEDERIERQRRNQEQDFNVRMKMEDIGATQVQPIGDIQPGFGSDWLAAGKKRQVTVPGGETYQVPTYEERQNRLLESIRAKGATEASIAIGRAAAVEDVRQKVRAQYAKDPTLHFNTVTQGDDLLIIGTDPKTGEEKSRQVFKGAGKGAAANVVIRSYTDGETGTRVTEIRDPKSGEMIRREVEKGAVTPRPIGAGRTGTTQKGMSAGARTMMRQAQEAIDKAKESNDPLDKEAALTAAQQAAEAYPDELEGGAGDGGWAYIKPKPRGQSAAPAGPDPRIGKIYVGPNGTKYRVKGISPSGKAIVEPVE